MIFMGYSSAHRPDQWNVFPKNPIFPNEMLLQWSLIDDFANFESNNNRNFFAEKMVETYSWMTKTGKLWNILDCGSHCRSLFCGTIPTIRPSLRRNDVKIRKMVKDMTVKMDGFSGSGYKVLVIKEPPLTTKKSCRQVGPGCFFSSKLTWAH